MNTWFTSDWHIGHENILKFTPRPFDNINDMAETFIKNYNKVVGKNDICYMIGDMFWSSMSHGEVRAILTRLKGKKILIIGNHDNIKINQAMNLGFHFASYSGKIKIGGEYVVLSHYPYRFGFWRQLWSTLKLFVQGKTRRTHLDKKRLIDDGEWLIHGHSHSSEKVKSKMIHIGVDAWGYKPVNLNEIVNIMRGVKYGRP